MLRFNPRFDEEPRPRAIRLLWRPLHRIIHNYRREIKHYLRVRAPRARPPFDLRETRFLAKDAGCGGRCDFGVDNRDGLLL
ncbi:hypothetical protein AMJ39_08355 [candidate division TA06 bacterium DG_24]|uniref:Uncharacterized protein n=3 Tax=Bacteria division TA06 TaxID=1156500 RepID=A0A0S8JFS8_UNCT6|nr:MAG: hypothetical protein AMJ39_08355 [candidate division TA06 bacterium DG_24]KPK70450.1 MAG: hypothetical protein AMJ82_03250 [candidate division TA06 bacterium SM23_40]KPL08490.1 MAG: hypothetical protein AMJ71_08260 [candidate division TA06 bacterium SM1_40]